MVYTLPSYGALAQLRVSYMGSIFYIQLEGCCYSYSIPAITTAVSISYQTSYYCNSWVYSWVRELFIFVPSGMKRPFQSYKI